MEVEKNELRWLVDTRVNMLKQERIKNEESQTKILSLEADKRRKLLDLLNKKMENSKVKISRCKDLFREAVSVDNGLEDCTKGTYTFL